MAEIQEVKVKFIVDDAGITKVEKDLKNVRKAEKDVADEFKKTGKTIQSESNNINKGIEKIGATLAAAFTVGAIVNFAKTAVGEFRKFEKALSELSSITGATGKDLEFFKRQAAEIGKTTSLSASQAVDAFKLIGSAKPELLKAKEALAQVAKEAVTLAEAAGIDLPTAAQSLAGALNQFQFSAEESSRVINALAAGSKEGAAAIPEISQSMDKFGTVAAAANITFEQSVGLIETLAEFNLKGAESGTQLRNIILKLQSANLGYVNGQFNLIKALEEVNAKQLDAAGKAKLFGLESITAGNILMTNVDKIQKYTDAVTGTSVAYEQQKINVDNLDGSIKGLSSAYEALLITLGKSENVRSAVDWLKELISAMDTLLQGSGARKAKAFEDYLGTIPELIRENVGELAKSYQALGETVEDSMSKATTQIHKEFLEQRNLAKANVQYINTLIELETDVPTYNKLIQQSKEANKELEIRQARLDAIVGVMTKAKAVVDESIVSPSDEKGFQFIEIDMDEPKQLKDYLDFSNEMREEDFKKRQALLKKTEGVYAAHYQYMRELGIEFERQQIEGQRALELERFYAIEQSADSINSLLDTRFEEERLLSALMLATSKAAAIAGVITQSSQALAIIQAQAASIPMIIPPGIPNPAYIPAQANAGVQSARVKIGMSAALASISAQTIGEVKRLAKGEINIKGAGSETSDSIPALLSRGESVMTAEETKRFMPTLKAIRERKVDPNRLNKTAQGFAIDYGKMGETFGVHIKKIPVNQTVFDENGVANYVLKNGSKQQRLNKRYGL